MATCHPSACWPPSYAQQSERIVRDADLELIAIGGHRGVLRTAPDPQLSWIGIAHRSPLDRELHRAFVARIVEYNEQRPVFVPANSSPLLGAVEAHGALVGLSAYGVLAPVAVEVVEGVVQLVCAERFECGLQVFPREVGRPERGVVE